MVYLLLWMFFGLAGYSLLAFRDVLKRLEQVSVEPDMYDRVNYTNVEFLKGLFFALLLGPLTLVIFYLSFRFEHE